MNKTFILSLGGSLIVPNQIDIKFLKSFKALIEKFSGKGYKFAIITGGGKTCRAYQQSLQELIGANQEALDWLGISVTHLNAQLVKSMFINVHPEIIKNPTKKINFKSNIVIGAGWKPGNSSDLDAVLVAKNLDAGTIINLTNIDYVYDKDPKKFSGAKKIEKISWVDFRKLVGEKWIPGSNLPFDPIASKKASSLKLKVIIVNGNNLSNLEKIFLDKDFIGTIIG